MAVEYIYDTNTINVFGEEDYGTITSAVDTTVDHGSIAAEPTQVDNYFYVWIDATVYPFGTVTVSGSAQQESTFNPPVTTQLFDVDGVADVRALSAWNGTGSLFEIGGGLERIAAPWIGSSGPLVLTGTAAESDVNRYSITSINTLAFVDFGAIASVPQTESDYGSVTAPLSGGQQDYGNIEDATTLTPFGSAFVVGQSATAEVQVYTKATSTTLFAISGDAILKQSPAHFGEGSITISGTRSQTIQRYVGASTGNTLSGTAIQKNTESYVGTGLAFRIGVAEESVTYDYNISTINLFTEIDFGSITSFTSEIDYGFVLSPEDAQVSYGNIEDLTTLTPFGSATISGTAQSNEIAVYTCVATGEISISGAADIPQTFTGKVDGGTIVLSGTRSQTIQRYFGAPTANVLSGTAIQKNTESYVGTGLAFRIGTAEESVTYDYNSASINVFTEIDLGSITSFTSELDYGSVLAQISAQVDYGNIEDAATLTPYGSLTLSGGHTESFGKGLYTASGSYLLSGAGAIPATITAVVDGGTIVLSGSRSQTIQRYAGDTAAYAFSGAATNIKHTESYVGTGLAFRIGTAEESVTYDYNASSVNTFVENDYGSVLDPTVQSFDYGLITSPLDALVDLGNIEDATTLVPYGSIALSGNAVESRKYQVLFNGGTITLSGEIVLPLAVSIVGVGSISLAGEATEKNTEDYVGTGSLFTASGAVEVYGPNPPESTTLHKFSGSAVEKNTEVYIGTGDLFTTISSTEYVIFNPPEDTLLYTFSGAATNIKHTESYVGTGNAFRIGTAIESVTYDYNESAVNTFIENDYGSVLDPTAQSFDYGLITSGLDAIVDLGNIEDAVTLTPYGSISLSGNGIESRKYQVLFNGGSILISGEIVLPLAVSIIGQGGATLSGAAVERNTESYVGTGSLFTASGAVEAYGPNPPESTTLHKFSGSAIEKNTEDYLVEAFDSNKQVSTTYPANNITFINTASFDDVSLSAGGTGTGSTGGFNIGSHLRFGYIAQQGTSTRAFNTTPQDATKFVSLRFRAIRGNGINGGETPDLASESLGLYYSTDGGSSFTFISNIVAYTDTSFNSLKYVTIDIPQAAKTQNTIFRVQQSSASGLQFDHYGITEISVFELTDPFNIIQLSGAATEKFLGNPTEDTVLYSIGGSAVERNTESYVGTGIAFRIGTLEESVTYNYNTSSINTFSELDLGSITSFTSELDYGSVLAGEDAQFDYGNIEDAVTLTPFGSITLSGSLVESFGEGLYTASGGATFSGAAVESASFNPPETSATYAYSGSAIEKNTEDYVGTGSTTISGNLIEKNTEIFFGFGFAFSIGGISESFGANPPESTTLHKFTGAAVEKNTEAYNGTGFTTTSGSAVEKNTESYVGTGDLFRFGTGPERVTYDYNESSINLLNVYDLGSVTQFNTEIDYGFVYNPIDDIDNYGVITNLTDLYPYGTITLSGSLVESFGEGLYTASGTATFSGQAIAKTNPKWIGSGTATLSGSAIEKNTEDYVGTGSLFTASGAVEAYGPNPPESTTLHVFSGAAVEKNTESYVGTGGLFTTISSTEYVVFNDAESTTLHKITGSAIERNTESYVGTGIAFRIGTAEESVTYDYNETSINLLNTNDLGSITQFSTEVDYGLVADPTAAIEDYGVVTDLIDLFPYGTITLSGSLVESFGEGLYTATGTATFSGNAVVRVTPRYAGTGTIALSGSAIEKNTESYVGVGSIFTASGAAESFGANPPESTTLHVFGGAAVEKNTEVYVGVGNLFTTISSTEYVVFTPPVSTTLFAITGSAIQKNTESYVGTGVAFNIGTADESVTYDYSETSINLLNTNDLGFITQFSSELDYGLVLDPTAAIEDYGNIEDIIDLFPFGTITLSGSSTESFGKGLYTATGGATIDVSHIEKNTESYVGSGSLFATGGHAESYTVDVPPVGYSFISTIYPANNITFIDTSSFNRVSLAAGGTGTGSTGGFNIGSHLRFGYVGPSQGNVTRAFNTTPQDATKFVSLTFRAIRGSDFNGGEDPDIAAESLGLYYSTDGGSSFTFVSDIVTYNDTSFNTLKYVTIEIPQAAKTQNTIFRVQQTLASDYTFDHYGITEITTTGLYPDISRFSGGAVEKNTETFEGSGALFGISGSFEYTVKDPFENTALYKIIGAAFLQQTYRDQGSGSLFTSSGAAEVFGANPPENTTLHVFSGAAVESASFNPPETSATYTYSGSAVERNTESYVGTGNATFTISSTEKNTEAYEGSGSLTTAFGGTGETFGANPPESTTLHVISGAAVEKNTESYVGTGTINVIPLPAGIRLSPSILSQLYRNFVGQAEESFSTAQSGTGTFISAFGAAEAFSAQTPENTILYTISGSATESFVAQTPESTTLHVFGGSAIEKNTEAYVGTGTTTASGVAVEKNTEAYQGTGSLYVASGAAEVFGANPPENTTLHVISGVATTSNIYVYQDFITSGQTTLSGSAVERNTEAYEGSGTTTASGILIEKNTESYFGVGDLFLFEGAAEAFGVNPVESTILYKILGAATNIKHTESYVGTGVEFISGTAVEKNTESYVGLGTATLSGVALESETDVYIGTGSISFASGAAEVFGANPPESTTLHKITGAAVERNTEAYVGIGTTTASGVVVEKNTESYVGLGSLFVINGASEAFGANPPENTTLHVFGGSAIERNTEAYVGTGVEYITGSAVERNTEVYVGIGTETISGTGVEKNTEAYVGTGSTTLSGIALESETDAYIGTGSLYVASGAAEVFGANPPENTTLHVFSGSAVEKNTESYVGSGFTSTSGIAHASRTRINIGSGQLFTFTGASEAFGANPVEGTILYSIGGSAVERNTEAYVGTGVEFISGAAVERNTEAYVGTGTETISGVAIESNTESYVGTGTQTITGVAVEKNTESYVGSGSLYVASGAAEVFGANPPESTTLHKITGAAIEKNTEAYYGVGSVTISGSAAENNTEVYIGTGFFAAFSGSAESITSNPPENTTLHVFSGSAIEKNTEAFAASGTLFTLGGSSEAFGANPPESTTLHVFSGSAIEKNTESYVGTGTQNLSGTAIEKHTESYVGSGSLYAVSGAAEAFSAQTPESTTLHVFSGSAIEKNTEVYVGTGSLFTVGSAADSSSSNPPEGTVIFSFSGAAVEKNTESYSGSGSLFTVGGASIASTNVSTGTGLFSFTGLATEKNTETYTGSILYRVEGAAFEVFEPSGYQGRGKIFVTGTRIKEEYRRFVKARTYVSIV